MTDRMDTEALRALVALGPLTVSHQNGDPEERFRGIVGPEAITKRGKPVRFYVAQYVLPENAPLFAQAPALAAEVLELRAEVEQLRATIGACRWLWPADDTSSEMCADHPRELAETIDAQEGEVFGYSRGGVVETRYFAYLRADDQSDSDDDFEVDEATEEAASAKILAEVARRTAQGDRA